MIQVMYFPSNICVFGCINNTGRLGWAMYQLRLDYRAGVWGRCVGAINPLVL